MESGVQLQPIGLSPEDRDALQALTDNAVRMLLDRDWDAFLPRIAGTSTPPWGGAESPLVKLADELEG